MGFFWLSEGFPSLFAVLPVSIVCALPNRGSVRVLSFCPHLTLLTANPHSPPHKGKMTQTPPVKHWVLIATQISTVSSIMDPHPAHFLQYTTEQYTFIFHVYERSPEGKELAGILIQLAFELLV